MAGPLRPLTRVAPAPVDEQGLVERLRASLAAAAYFLLFVPAVPLLVLSLLLVPLGLTGLGIALAHAVVPATGALARVHRRLSGALLGETLPEAYADTTGRGFLARPMVWLRDPHRWRDVGFLAFSATGGAVLAGLPALLLVTPAVHLVLAVTTGGWVGLVLLGTALLAPLLWWVLTPPLVRARAMAERSILGVSRGDLERRVEQVVESRAETLDHSAAEVRRIERDLHDGAQARIASVGMNVGLAEKLMATDPAAAAELLREARESTVTALEDLRSVVRGIHPPVLADRGLAGAIEALAVPIPLPVTTSVAVPALPAPVESAAYFAVAECLANTVKHARATRAWVQATHDGEVLRIVVGDDGRGGATPTGSGITGIARRLAAFDGWMTVTSPDGGPTQVTMEVPCRTSPADRPTER
ncbi:histidine kinase [Nocardioides sp. SYSU D00038]|uniref:sensor histidine kinase n=1 Tax=Nocardioides sp. SYSU D00038 TaxID=2812554 RepID=UPI0019684502|nr:histidine kinase [Nocardioides sp. SYSU D00038]